MTGKKVDLNLRLYCKDCKDPVPNIVENFAAGDLICGNCGLVLGNRIIDTRSEWRTFSNSDEGNDDPSRVGDATITLFDSILESTTSTSSSLNNIINKDEKSKKLLDDAFREIHSLASRISLNKVVIETAKQLYKKAEEKRAEGERSLKIKKKEYIIATCIFIACKQCRVPRTFKEICNLTKVPKKEIGRCYNLLKKILYVQGPEKTKIDDISIDEIVTVESGNDKIESFIGRFGTQLALPPNIQKYAKTIAINAANDGTLGGKSTTTLVAAALYFATHMQSDQRSSKEVAEVCGCTESTMKTAYKQLYKHRDKITPPEIPSDAWFAP